MVGWDPLAVVIVSHVLRRLRSGGTGGSETGERVRTPVAAGVITAVVGRVPEAAGSKISETTSERPAWALLAAGQTTRALGHSPFLGPFTYEEREQH